MRLLFLTIGRRTTPSTRFRVKQYLSHLNKDGIHCDVKSIPHTFYKRLSLLRGISAYDAVIIQKKLFSSSEISILKKRCKNLIYDFDDLVTVEHPMHERSEKVMKRMRKNEKRFINTLKSVRGVIAGNTFLKDIAKEHNNNVAIVPTPVELKGLPRKEVSSSDGLVIGWIGTRSNLFYLDNLKSALRGISEKFPGVSLKVVCNSPYETDAIKVINKEWVAEDEPADLLSFDIGIMPLTDDDWSKGKCGFKLLQYMSAGLPTVSSHVGTNIEIIDDGVNGFLAKSADDWVDKLSRLIDDTSLRERIGIKARETVEEKYSVSVCKDRLVEALRSFIRG